MTTKPSDPGSAEPSTEPTGDVRSQPDAPRTAPSSDAPTPISVALSVTPLSDDGRDTPFDDPSATPISPALSEAGDEVAQRSADTLLSAPVPADRRELQLEDRMDELARRLGALDERLRRVEYRTLRPEPEPRQAPGWIWIAFLLALALIATLVRLVK